MLKFRQIIGEAIRIKKLDPSIIQKILTVKGDKKAKKIQQTTIASILNKEGFQGKITSPKRKAREGFTIQLFQNNFVMVVTWDDPILQTKFPEKMKKINEIETILQNNGYVVFRPAAPDFLFVLSLE